MANCCLIDICIYGKRKDIDAFIKDLCLDENGSGTRQGILSRYVSDFFYTDTTIHEINNYNIYEDVVSVLFNGSCRWSVNSAFDMDELKKISKKYKILIDIYGEEAGFEFVEEHVFLDGEKIFERVGDYCCYWTCDYESYDEFKKAVPFADINIKEFEKLKKYDECYEFREFDNSFDHDKNLELYFEKYKDENNLEENKNGNYIIM